MRDYKPRRCSKRWLDGDCPAEVLAIMDHGTNDPAPERYDVIYAEVSEFERERWMTMFALSEKGLGYHVEMQAHEVAGYRYRKAYRYTKWSTLPDAVKAAVRRDLAEAVA